jgi:hypothetical protein
MRDLSDIVARRHAPGLLKVVKQLLALADDAATEVVVTDALMMTINEALEISAQKLTPSIN